MPERLIGNRRSGHFIQTKRTSPHYIKNLRKRLKLTQAAAAALVRVNPNTWARWERGESEPRGALQRQAIIILPLLANSKAQPGTVGVPQADHSLNRQHRHSTARSLLKYAGAWVGDDLEECLKLVYLTRSKAEF